MVDQYLDVLSKCALFKDIPLEELEVLLRCTMVSIESYDKNINIVRKGEVRNSFIIVLDGQLKTVHGGHIEQANFVERINPSHIFGLAFCFTQVPSHVNLKTTRKSLVIEINHNRLRTPCEKNCSAHHKAIENMLRVLSTKVVTLSEKIDYMHMKTLRAKLSAYILNHYNENEHGILYLDMNKTELAEYLGSSRSSLTRELGIMQSDGLIEYHLKCFRILNLVGLRSAMINE